MASRITGYSSSGTTNDEKPKDFHVYIYPRLAQYILMLLHGSRLEKLLPHQQVPGDVAIAT
jgi:hypothetical protein